MLDKIDDFAFRISTVSEIDFVKEARRLARRYMPEWDFDAAGDLGSFILKIYIKALMQGIYLANSWAQESNILTARDRDSVLLHAQKLGYRPSREKPSRTYVELTIDRTDPNMQAITIPAFKFQMSTRNKDGPDEVFFENEEEIRFAAENKTVLVPMISGQSYQDTFRGTGGAEQRIILSEPNVLEGSINVVQGTDRWILVDSFFDSGPDDLHYTVAEKADGRVEISFGDGLSGKSPLDLDGSVTFRVGGGRKANIPKEHLDFVLSVFPGMSFSGKNINQARGGEDQEFIDLIKRRAVLNIRQRGVLANLKEVVEYCEIYPGVERATGTLVGQAVAVFVSLAGGGDLEQEILANGGGSFKERLEKDLDDRLIMGYRADVRSAFIRAPEINISFETKEGYLSAEAEKGIVEDLAAALNLGAFYIDRETRKKVFNRDFGQGLFRNEIAEIIGKRPDVEKNFEIIEPKTDILIGSVEIISYNLDKTRIVAKSRNQRQISYVRS